MVELLLDGLVCYSLGGWMMLRVLCFAHRYLRANLAPGMPTPEY